MTASDGDPIRKPGSHGRAILISRTKSSMGRKFFIYATADAECTVQEEGIETTHTFPDILAAISFIHRQRCGDEVHIRCFDQFSNIVFETTA
ncbi:MAG TPA: hypothetical protein VGM54_23335 [Chthoniobacter sp.]|jgi:hypothetical protein